MLNAEQLKIIANNPYWNDLKELLVLYIDDIDRVSKPLIIDGITITPNQAYLGKLLAVQTINEFINSVDSMKSGEERASDVRDSMI